MIFFSLFHNIYQYEFTTIVQYIFFSIDLYRKKNTRTIIDLLLLLFFYQLLRKEIPANAGVFFLQKKTNISRLFLIQIRF